MNLADVMDEVGDKLTTIPGLRVAPYGKDSIAPPAGIVTLPETINFDETYGRGSDSMTLFVHVLVGKPSDRKSRDAIAKYADGSGAYSVKQKLDSSGTNTYTSCHTVTVDSVEFAVIAWAGVDYLAGTFKVDIHGSGA